MVVRIFADLFDNNSAGRVNISVQREGRGKSQSWSADVRL